MFLLNFCRPGAIFSRATEGSAGYDLVACIDQTRVIYPGGVEKIPTGVKLQMPNNLVCGMVTLRSGLASKSSLFIPNSPGIIDSDYTGEIMVLVGNYGNEPFSIVRHQKFAQLVFTTIVVPVVHKAEILDETERGENGFGSTGY